MLRKTVAALFVTLVAMLGIWVPSVSAAYVSNAKVVIIVGAVHGQTASYRDRGDAAYAEAKKFTPNVTRVYSPNATWSKVKAATTNANIVIYMGHGNGWPSPYTYDPKYTTKDGLGLNATAGNGDYNVKYYGEPYVDDLDLAPNAIVLLHHLCYASGNSEPGKAEPSVSTARQRAMNYAAGFLRSPARAVIADGHMGAACSRPTSRSSRSGGMRPTTTATSSASRRRATPGGPCTWTRTRRQRASTARSS